MTSLAARAPVKGAQRQRRIFLWFPRIIRNEIRWLEWISIVEVCRYQSADDRYAFDGGSVWVPIDAP